jgi:hypothetical protein
MSDKLKPCQNEYCKIIDNRIMVYEKEIERLDIDYQNESNENTKIILEKCIIEYSNIVDELKLIKREIADIQPQSAWELFWELKNKHGILKIIQYLTNYYTLYYQQDDEYYGTKHNPTNYNIIYWFLINIKEPEALNILKEIQKELE